MWCRQESSPGSLSKDSQASFISLLLFPLHSSSSSFSLNKTIRMMSLDLGILKKKGFLFSWPVPCHPLEDRLCRLFQDLPFPLPIPEGPLAYAQCFADDRVSVCQLKLEMDNVVYTGQGESYSAQEPGEKGQGPEECTVEPTGYLSTSLSRGRSFSSYCLGERGWAEVTLRALPSSWARTERSSQQPFRFCGFQVFVLGI